MSSVIDYLRRFNRKERFILLDHVLGQQGEAQGENTAHWLKLPLRDCLLKVTRCDSDGKNDENGDSLAIRKSKGG